MILQPKRIVARLRQERFHEQTNVLWDQLRPIFDFAFLAAVQRASQERYTPEERLLLYSTKRSSPQYPRATQAIIDQLPAAEPRLHDLLGYVEADVLHWLMNQDAISFLVLVGPRGIGKSALLQHVFTEVRQRYAALNNWCPILVNLLGHSKIDERGVISLLLIAIQRFFDREPSLGMESFRAKHRVDTGGGTVEYAVSLDRFMRSLVVALRETERFPLFIFDNCDQLPPVAIQAVVKAAKNLAIDYDIKCIVAMRPPNERTQIELPSRVSSFLHLAIDVPPPDVEQLVLRRLELAKRRMDRGPHQVLLNLRGHIPHEFKSESAIFRKLFGTYVGKRFSEILARELCNLDTRQVLECIRNLLMNPTLPVIRLEHERIGLGVPKYTPWRTSDRLRAVMVGARDQYIEHDAESSTRSPVANIFSIAGALAQSPCLCLQHRILKLLEWLGAHADVQWCNTCLQTYGYSANMVRNGLQKLLTRRLIMSPETDHDMSDASAIFLTPAGRFLLQHVATTPAYISTVVADTLLPHAEWDGDPSDSIGQVSSMIELLEEVIAEERSQLSAVRATDLHTLFITYSGKHESTRDLRGAIELLSKDVYHACFEAATEVCKQYRGHRTMNQKNRLTSVLSQEVHQLQDDVETLVKLIRPVQISEHTLQLSGDRMVRVVAPKSIEQDQHLPLMIEVLANTPGKALSRDVPISISIDLVGARHSNAGQCIVECPPSTPQCTLHLPISGIKDFRTDVHGQIWVSEGRQILGTVRFGGDD